MSWSDQHTQHLVEATSSMFKLDNRSVRSETRSTVENLPQTVLKRVRSQIIETYQQGLSCRTPEEWDRSFRYLGGGSGRRTSKAILQRMTWDNFLLHYDEVVSTLSDQT